MAKKQAPKVGVALIIHRNGQVLLLRRAGVHGGGTWSTPGGHLEWGETPEACAIRETREEADVEVSNVRFVAITNDFFEESGKHYITIWMEGDYASGEAVVNAPYESDQVGWFGWEALPEPLFLSLVNLRSGRCYPIDGWRRG